MDSVVDLCFKDFKFRMSLETDEEIIRELVSAVFGDREKNGTFKDLNGRYLLAFDGDELVAMTGINSETTYAGSEVDWTCTRPDKRGLGLMTVMFGYLLKKVKEDVYCSCWRFVDSPINLRSQMCTFGFEPVLVPRVQCDSRYSKTCVPEKCKAYREIKGSCHCYEDLYVKRFGGN